MTFYGFNEFIGEYAAELWSVNWDFFDKIQAEKAMREGFGHCNGLSDKRWELIQPK